MAKKTFRLLEQGADSGHVAFDGREVGDEFEHDFGADPERAVIAAGWVELVEEKPSEKTSTTKPKGQG